MNPVRMPDLHLPGSATVLLLKPMDQIDSLWTLGLLRHLMAQRVIRTFTNPDFETHRQRLARWMRVRESFATPPQ